MKKSHKSLLNANQIQELFSLKGVDNDQSDILEELESYVVKRINEQIKEERKKYRIEKLDAEKERLPAKDHLTCGEIESLPKWVKCDLSNAALIGKSKRVIQTTDGKKYHIDNRLNSLSGSEWTYFLNSVINTRYPTTGNESYAHQIRKVHPSPKPPQLTKQLIEFFTKEGETVFDYFMGVGGTLLGASLCGRHALGVDLNPEYISTYIQASNNLNLEIQPTIVGDATFLLQDTTEISNALNGEKVSMILIDPPYGNMMARPKTGEITKKKSDNTPTPFTNSDSDLGNMPLSQFFGVLKSTIQSSLNFLRNKGHLVVFIKDMQPNRKELNLLHADLIYLLNEIPELKYLGLKIWADQGVNLYPYGYPYSYVANQIHQYILIFRKILP